MLPDLKLIIRLQDIDHRLADLAREIASLPVHIAEIEKKLVAHEVWQTWQETVALSWARSHWSNGLPHFWPSRWSVFA